MERETVTMLMRGQPKDNKEDPATEKDVPEFELPALPAHAPAREKNKEETPLAEQPRTSE